MEHDDTSSPDVVSTNPLTDKPAPTEPEQREMPMSLLAEGILDPLPDPPVSEDVITHLKEMKKWLQVLGSSRVNRAKKENAQVAVIKASAGAISCVTDHLSDLHVRSRYTFVDAHGRYIKFVGNTDKDLRKEIQAKFDQFTISIMRLLERHNKLEQDYNRMQENMLALFYILCERGVFDDSDKESGDSETRFLDNYEAYQRMADAAFPGRIGVERMRGSFGATRLVGQAKINLYNVAGVDASPQAG